MILECEGSRPDMSDISSPSSPTNLSLRDDYWILEKFRLLSFFLLQMMNDLDTELFRYAKLLR